MKLIWIVSMLYFKHTAAFLECNTVTSILIYEKKKKSIFLPPQKKHTSIALTKISFHLSYDVMIRLSDTILVLNMKEMMAGGTQINTV